MLDHPPSRSANSQVAAMSYPPQQPPPQETLGNLLLRQAAGFGPSRPTDMLQLSIVLPSMQYLEDNLEDVLDQVPSDIVMAYADQNPHMVPKPTAWEMAPFVLEKISIAMRDIIIGPTNRCSSTASLLNPHEQAKNDVDALVVETGGHFAVMISHMDPTEEQDDNETMSTVDTTEERNDNEMVSTDNRELVSDKNHANDGSVHDDGSVHNDGSVHEDGSVHNDDDQDELSSVDIQRLQQRKYKNQENGLDNQFMHCSS